jgi:autotransporter-associated beta strand protein/T5SS/PEP-CTERM-associated repeat protein
LNLESGSTITTAGPSIYVGAQGGIGRLNLSGTGSGLYLSGGLLDVGSGSGSNGAVNISGTSFIDMSTGNLYVGNGGTGALNISESAYINSYGTAGDIEIGRAGGTGSLNMTGGVVMQSISSTHIGLGAGSIGHASLSGSAQYSYSGTGEFIVGRNSGVGDMTVSGATFTHNSTGRLGIGIDTAGKGTLNLGTDAILNFKNGEMQVGAWSNTAEGTVNMTGNAVFNKASTLMIGMDAGKGTFNMSGTSSINSTAGDLQVGRFSAADSTFNMSESATITHTGGNLRIGLMGGHGTFNMTGGTLTQTGSLLLLGSEVYGSQAHGFFNLSGNAQCNLTGGASLVVAQDTCFGEMTLADTAQVNMNNSVDSFFFVGNHGTGKFTMTGGTVSLSNGTSFKVAAPLFDGDASAGTFIMSGGTFTVANGTAGTNAYTHIGARAGSVGIMEMSNGATYNHNSTSNCYIGDGSGEGTLSMVGSAAGVTPVVTTTFNTPNAAFRLGNSAKGTLNMGQNAVLNASQYITFGGSNATGDATVNMTGNALINKAGTRSILAGELGGKATINMAGTSQILTSTANLEVGKNRNSQGTILMSDSANIALTGKTLYLGYGGTGNLTMTDSSTLNLTTLQVATSYTDSGTLYNGNGTLTLGDGTVGDNPTINIAASGTLNVGHAASATGSVIVNSGTLNIGGASVTTNVGLAGGNGSITVNGGTILTGAISSGKMNIGSGAGSVGSVTVNDGGTFNTLATAMTVSAMNFGVSGGTFTWTQNGGYTVLPRVNTGGNGSNVTYNLNGGVFEVSQIRPASGITSAGTTVVNFNGGTIKARETTTQFLWRRETLQTDPNSFVVNVKPGGGTVDTNGVPGFFGYGVVIREWLKSVDASGTLITAPGTGGVLTVTDSTGTETTPGTGILTLVADNSGFVGNIVVNEGSIVGRGVSALGFGSVARTITVNPGGTLGFASSNMYAGDFASTVVPTINIQGGTLAVVPYVTYTGAGTEADPYVYTYNPVRAAVNNVTLNNGSMTSSSDAVVLAEGASYAWHINGTVTSHGTSAINATSGTGLITLQSGDMANPATTFDVADGTLTVAATSTLVDGLSSLGIARATGLTKTGNGTMTLLGNAAYTGNTTVLAGTLNALNINTPGAAVSVTGSNTVLTATSIVANSLTIGGTHTAAAVPEPSTIVLLILAASSAILTYIRRR